jgi:hypothetical protein
MYNMFVHSLGADGVFGVQRFCLFKVYCEMEPNSEVLSSVQRFSRVQKVKSTLEIAAGTAEFQMQDQKMHHYFLVR